MERRDAFHTVRLLISEYAKRHVKLTAASVLSTLVLPIQDVLLPHLTGSVVNSIRSGDGSAMRRSILMVGLAMLIIQIAFVGVDIIDAKLFPSMQKFVRRHMLDVLIDKHDSQYSSDLPVGEIISKLSRTPPLVASWFEHIKGMIPNLLVYIASTVYFWTIDPWLGVALLATVLLSFASLAYNLHRCADVSTIRDQRLNEVHEMLDELLHNLPAIYASGTRHDEALRIEPTEDEFEHLYYRTILCATTVKAWMVPACIALIAFVLFRCYRLLRSHRLSVGTFVSIFTVVLYLMASMMRVVSHSRSMAYYWGTIQSSLDLLARADRHDPQQQQQPDYQLRLDDPRDTVFSMRGVEYRYSGSARPTVQGVNMDLREGERLAIVGRMGSGKTTLIKLMLRLIEPTAGELSLFGRPYTSMSAAEVRKRFGYVPQSAPLFNRPVSENAAYGTPAATLPPAERDQIVLYAAAALGLSHVLEALPDGLNTRAGKGGSRLSGGQRQAVWLMRMALLRPAVLILDEATASMDAASQAAIAEAVRQFRTVVLISHDAGFVRAVATRSVLLENGRLMAHELLRDAETPISSDPDQGSDNDKDAPLTPQTQPPTEAPDIWDYDGNWV